jgi:hypothetical protein
MVQGLPKSEVVQVDVGYMSFVWARNDTEMHHVGLYRVTAPILVNQWSIQVVKRVSVTTWYPVTHPFTAFPF